MSTCSYFIKTGKLAFKSDWLLAPVCFAHLGHLEYSDDAVNSPQGKHLELGLGCVLLGGTQDTY